MSRSTCMRTRPRFEPGPRALATQARKPDSSLTFRPQILISTRMRVLLLAALTLTARLPAGAELTNNLFATRPLSLRQCFDLALSRNLDLQIEHLNTEIASDDLFSSYGVYVPTLSFRAEHDFVSQPQDFNPKMKGQDLRYALQNALSTDGRL